MLNTDKLTLFFLHKQEQKMLRSTILCNLGPHPEVVVSGECIQWVAERSDIAPRGWLDSVITQFF